MIHWDLRCAREHPGVAAGAPPPGLLSAPERVFFGRLRTPRRQQEWLLGRWAAKELCREFLKAQGREVPSEAVTVAPDADGAPYVLIAGAGALPVTLSISHRDDHALVALVDAPHAPLGADLEKVEPRGPGFLADYFTAAEQAAVQRAAEPDRAVTEAWAVKEAALKAVRLGLRADTRRVEARPRPVGTPGWTRATVTLELEGLPGAGTVFVQDLGEYVACLAWLGAGEQLPEERERGTVVKRMSAA